MATMITSECINCGACEPECPNNAISQDAEIFVIDPKLCTECVGFHDYEACAAVCPVDCCVTDSNNIEAEDVLIARARALHPEVESGDNFESRFRKGAAPPSGTPRATPSALQGSESSAVPPQPAAAPSSDQPLSRGEQAGEPGNGQGPSLTSLSLPDAEKWEITVQCFKCGEPHKAPAKHFMIGNVLFCPHCFKPMVVKDKLNFQIRTAFKDVYQDWEKRLLELQAKRENVLREFRDRREKELRSIEIERERAIESLNNQLKQIADSYDAPGRPLKKRGLFSSTR